MGKTVKYVEHEFATLYPNFPHSAGFSLQTPSLWDLTRMRSYLDLHFDESFANVEQSFSLKAMDAGLVVAHLPQVIFRRV